MWPLRLDDVLAYCGLSEGASNAVGAVDASNVVRAVGASSGAAGAADGSDAASGARWVCGATGSLNDLAPGDLFVALPFVDGDAHAHVEKALSLGAAAALVQKDWPGFEGLSMEHQRLCFATENVLSTFRTFAGRFRRGFDFPVVAIAGANGKTTTKEMLGAMLTGVTGQVVRTPGTDNGFVGLPRTLCDRRLRSGEDVRAVVLEIGIDAPLAMVSHAEMAAPNVVVLTALGPEHLDGFGCVERAVFEEFSLLSAASGARRVLPLGDPFISARRDLFRPGDLAVVNAHQGEKGAVDAALNLLGCETFIVLRACPKGPVCETTLTLYSIRNGSLQCLEEEQLVLPMAGAHNARNCALAAGAAVLLGLSLREVAAGFQSFVAPSARSRSVMLRNEVILLDDSFNASPLSMAAALRALEDVAWGERPKIAVLGDMLGLGSEEKRYHSELAEALFQTRGIAFFLYGHAMGEVYQYLLEKGAGDKVLGYSQEGDPTELLADFLLPQGALILVKGSRGLRMERVTFYLEAVYSKDVAAVRRLLSEMVTVIGVLGSSHVNETSAALCASLAKVGIRIGVYNRDGGNMDGRRITVAQGEEGCLQLLVRCAVGGVPIALLALSHNDLWPHKALFDLEIAVFTGFSEADKRPGVDIERHLAEKAQIFARSETLKTAVLCGDEEVVDLIANVVKKGVRVVRGAAALATERDVIMAVSHVIDALGRTTDGPGPRLC